MIDARHVENPPEMSCLVAIRSVANGLRASVVGNGKSRLDSISVPGVQGNQTPSPGEKLRDARSGKATAGGGADQKPAGQHA
jgi:hypothetical protein